MYVYIKSKGEPYTVGFYDPIGSWHPESDWTLEDGAAARVHYLNGGFPEKEWEYFLKTLDTMSARLSNLR